MLRQRIASALVGMAILLSVLWLGGPLGWGVFVAAIGIAACIEFYVLAARSNVRPMVVVGCLWTALLILTPLDQSSPDRAATLVFGGGLVASLVWLLLRPNKEGSLSAFAWTVGGVLYVGWLSRYLVSLRGTDSGRAWILMALFTTFATDTLAYFVGRALGRHKLSPRISPGKTKEGALGGVVGGVAAAVLLAWILALPLRAWQAAVLGLAISIFGQVGDLVESMFKRSAGVKDSGRLMPGHGGILDRVDSILLTGAVVYYYVLFLE